MPRPVSSKPIQHCTPCWADSIRTLHTLLSQTCVAGGQVHVAEQACPAAHRGCSRQGGHPWNCVSTTWSSYAGCKHGQSRPRCLCLAPALPWHPCPADRSHTASAPITLHTPLSHEWVAEGQRQSEAQAFPTPQSFCGRHGDSSHRLCCLIRTIWDTWRACGAANFKQQLPRVHSQRLDQPRTLQVPPSHVCVAAGQVQESLQELPVPQSSLQTLLPSQPMVSDGQRQLALQALPVPHSACISRHMGSMDDVASMLPACTPMHGFRSSMGGLYDYAVVAAICQTRLWQTRVRSSALKLQSPSRQCPSHSFTYLTCAAIALEGPRRTHAAGRAGVARPAQWLQQSRQQSVRAWRRMSDAAGQA